ncbi:MAG: hypothetical protein QM504_10240 [Pseudomonadota bacterium]
MSLTQESMVQGKLNILVDPVQDNYLNLLVIEGNNKQGLPVLTVWKGRQAKPFVNYRFKNDAERNEYLEGVKAVEKKRAQEKEQRAQEKKNFVPDFEIGDVFVGSWGYGQTNVDAYQIVGKPSKHYSLIREIGLVRLEGSHGHDCCDVKPDVDNFLSKEPLRKKVTMHGISINSCISLSKWDGKRKYYKSWYH